MEKETMIFIIILALYILGAMITTFFACALYGIDNFDDEVLFFGAVLWPMFITLLLCLFTCKLGNTVYEINKEKQRRNKL